MALRKNQRWLTAYEKKAFTDALLALKAEKTGPNPQDNTYDQFVTSHQNNMAAGHFGPAFFAWHREFLRRFELELQRITNDPSLGLPYWDWSVDNSQTSSIWGSDFMGPNGRASDGKVMDGPFAYDKGEWVLNVRDPGDPLYLRRQFGPNPGSASSLPTPANVQAALNATPYDVSPWDPTSKSGFRNMGEGNIPSPGGLMHIRVHEWVGGNMSSAYTSPNDPVFWLHHCYMDKVWADWQRLHPNVYWYLPDGGAGTGHNLKDRMAPWNDKAPKDLLEYWNLGYHYDNDNYLMPFDVLYWSQSITSTNRRFYIKYNPSTGNSSDNNLELLDNSTNWTTWLSTASALPPQSPAQGIGWCVMQDDGNLVIYAGFKNTWNFKAFWATNTVRNSWSYLQVGDNGQLTMYDWSTMQPIDPPWSVPPPSVGNPPKG